jgi:hypothetical protein
MANGWRPLVRWTARYPVLAFVSLLLLGFAWRLVATPLGIPDLF